MYTTINNAGVWTFVEYFKICFLRLLRLHLFDRKLTNIMKYYYKLKELFTIWIYFKM